MDQFLKDYLSWGGPHAGAGEENEDEGVTETKCNGLSATLISHSSVPFGGMR